MKKIGLFLFLLVVGSSQLAHAVILDPSMVTAFGTVDNIFKGPEKTIDNDPGTNWAGTDNIQIGETDFLAYQFDMIYNITQIDFRPGFANAYYMGEMDVETSLNSTDGLDGSWTRIVTGFTEGSVGGDGQFEIIDNFGNTQWVRLLMTYEGRFALGTSPQFLLNEIDFHAEPATIIPEPSTFILLGTGLLGLALTRRKRHAK